MKPPKNIVRVVAPFKIDPEIIKQTKEASDRLGYKFYYQYVEAVLKRANRKVK